MPADFDRTRSKAMELLLSSRLYGLKTDITKLKYDKNIIFHSYSSFCSHSRTTLTELESCEALRDGCTIRRKTADSVLYLVLYNDKIKSQKRRRFTLAHEVGHIMLEHENDGADEEAEANLFAAELILPRILVRELQTRSGFKITACEIADIFGVSQAASANQIKSLGRISNFSDSERLLLGKLKGFLPDFEGPVVNC